MIGRTNRRGQRVQGGAWRVARGVAGRSRILRRSGRSLSRPGSVGPRSPDSTWEGRVGGSGGSGEGRGQTGGSGSGLFSSLFGPTATAVRPTRRRRRDGPARPGHPRPDRRAANGRSLGDRGVLRRDESAGSPRPGSGTDSRSPGPMPGPPSRVVGGAWRVEGPRPAGGSPGSIGMAGDPARPGRSAAGRCGARGLAGLSLTVVDGAGLTMSSAPPRGADGPSRSGARPGRGPYALRRGSRPPRLRHRGGQPDSHEEPRECLREMLAVRGKELGTRDAPGREQRLQDRPRQREDLVKIHDAMPPRRPRRPEHSGG